MGWRMLLCACLLGALATVVVAAPPRPFLFNRVVMVPYRYIAEWAGATVQYHPETLSVTTALDGRTMMLTINAPTAKVKEKKVLLSIPPTLQQWLTYVPLAFAAETLETEITWDAELEKVTVTHPRSGQRLVLRTGAERVIFDAVENGALPDVEAALTEREDALVARDRDGATPLHVAVRAGHYAVAAMLLLRGAAVNALDARERTPLHDAVALARPDLVRLLVDGGADIRADHLDIAQLNALLARAGQTEKPAAALLHDAVRQQLDDLVVVLIEKGADVSAPDDDGRTALHLAVAAGSARMTGLLLAHKAPVNAKDADDRTPLAVALATGDPAIVRLLVEAGADINAPGIDLARLDTMLQPEPEPAEDTRVSTPLHTAVSQGLAAVLPLLLKNEEARGHLNRQDAEGNTPLLLALAAQQHGMAKQLLEAGADVTLANDEGDTALHLCARTGNIELAKLLLETHQAPLDPLNARRYSPLAVAVEAKRAPLAAYLMGKGASLDVPTVNLTALETLLEQVRATPPAAPAVQPGMAADAATPLHRAAGAGLTMVVQRLLEQGADANARDAEDVTPLHLAAAAGAVPVIEALLTARADPRAEDREGNTPLHRALLAGKDGTAVLLLRNGADPLREHPEGGTPLHLAVARHLPKTVIALLTAEVPVDALDRFERTPLMLAAERNDVELARLLLTRGANPALCARDGISVFGRAMPAVAALLLPPLPEYAVASRPEWTFLHKGAAEGKLPYVRTMMLASKAQANATDELGRTPLHVVSTAEGARVLIARGANVNAPDKEKRTPLLAALLRGNDDVARELLTAGAFVNLRDAADFSPLRIALQRKSAEMARALVEKGADVTEPILKQVTPVHLAVALDDEALMQALLTAKFAVAVRDPVCGAQPLHWAALRGQTAAMTLLFEQGAYVMVPDTQGCTPLHWAAASGQAKALSLLLERKAPRAAADNDGLTALDFARHYGWTEAVAVLAPEAAP